VKERACERNQRNLQLYAELPSSPMTTRATRDQLSPPWPRGRYKPYEILQKLTGRLDRHSSRVATEEHRLSYKWTTSLYVSVRHTTTLTLLLLAFTIHLRVSASSSLILLPSQETWSPWVHSVVDIATWYRLNVPECEPQQGQEMFSKMSKPTPWCTQFPIK
jgi:hypothetical protein